MLTSHDNANMLRAEADGIVISLRCIESQTNYVDHN